MCPAFVNVERGIYSDKKLDQETAKKMLQEIGKTVIPSPSESHESEQDKEFSKLYLKNSILKKKVKTLEENIEETDKLNKRIWELEQFNNEKSLEHKDCDQKILGLKDEIDALDGEKQELEQKLNEQKETHRKKQEEYRAQVNELQTTLENRVKQQTELILNKNNEENAGIVKQKDDLFIEKDREIASLKSKLFQASRPFIDLSYQDNLGRNIAFAAIAVIAVEIILRFGFDLWRFLK